MGASQGTMPAEEEGDDVGVGSVERAFGRKGVKFRSLIWASRWLPEP